MPVRAHLTFKNESMSPMGRERIRLLEAVAREGSITAAAKAVGLTYKAAWDGLNAMANLFGRPLLDTRHGGRSGGGATLTEAGQTLVASFNRLEAELERMLRSLEPDLLTSGLAPASVLPGFLMRTSCRNVLRGTVRAAVGDAISAEIAIEISPNTMITALITKDSMISLGLCPGRDVVVLVKASFVMIATGAAGRISARNRIPGVVSRCETESVAAEVVLDIGDGRTITASVTADAVASLDLHPGVEAFAVFDPGHVILAVD